MFTHLLLRMCYANVRQNARATSRQQSTGPILSRRTAGGRRGYIEFQRETIARRNSSAHAKAHRFKRPASSPMTPRPSLLWVLAV